MSTYRARFLAVLPFNICIWGLSLTAIVLMIFMAPMFAQTWRGFLGIGINSNAEEAVKEAGWNVAPLGPMGRYLASDALTRDECKAIRMMSAVTMDSAHHFPDFFANQADSSSEFDGMDRMFAVLAAHPEAAEHHQRLLPVVLTLTRIMESARLVAASLLGLPYLRFEANNMMHRWTPMHVLYPPPPAHPATSGGAREGTAGGADVNAAGGRAGNVMGMNGKEGARAVGEPAGLQLEESQSRQDGGGSAGPMAMSGASAPPAHQHTSRISSSLGDLGPTSRRAHDPRNTHEDEARHTNRDRARSVPDKRASSFPPRSSGPFGAAAIPPATHHGGHHVPLHNVYPFSMGFHFDNCQLSVPHDIAQVYFRNKSLGGEKLVPLCEKLLRNTRYRIATAVFFLNDEEGEDVEGGELFFGASPAQMVRSMKPETREEDFNNYTAIRPRCGRVAIFRGDVHNPHAVGQVWRGERWVLQLFMIPGLPFSIPEKDVDADYFLRNMRLFFGRMLLYVQLRMGIVLPWYRLGAYALRFAILHLAITFYYPRCSPWLNSVLNLRRPPLSSPQAAFLALAVLLVVFMQFQEGTMGMAHLAGIFGSALLASIAGTVHYAYILRIDTKTMVAYRFGLALLLFTFALICQMGDGMRRLFPLDSEVVLPASLPSPAHPGLRFLPKLD